MKVKVRAVQPTITMTKRMYNSYMHDMEQFLEENKTLRLRECHLQDELHIVKQQNEELQQKATDLEDTIEQSRLDTQDSSMRLGHIVAQALQEKKAAQDTAAELNVELMERDCRIDELERQIEWLRDKNDEWAMIADNQKNTIAAHYEEKKAFEDAIRGFEETRKDYEETIHNLHVEKREWMEKYEEEYHRRLEAEHSSP